MYDVLIIGAGVSGCAIARELSRLEATVCVLEREEDVGCGTSKANSGIVHAGFDATPGTLKALLNVRGNEQMSQLTEELDIPFVRNGSLVVCTEEQDKDRLEALYESGKSNQVQGLRMLTKEEVVGREPHINKSVMAALYAPTGGIICPFELTIALAENACSNGVEFIFHEEVVDIHATKGVYHVVTNCGHYEARAVVNASGVYAAYIHGMVSEKPMHMTPRRGEYMLLDKTAGCHVSHTIFPVPGKYGKGVLVTPTVHGNLLIGPTAENIADGEGTNTTAQGLERIQAQSAKIVLDIPYEQVITSFAGVRAQEKGEDFIIEESEPFFFNCAGIASPGLSSAPAVGEMVAGMVKERLNLQEKCEFYTTRVGIAHAAGGHMICRCEQVSEGEIREAIKRNPGAKSLDGVKRRTRAGMGRCQSGFCMSRVTELLIKEQKIEYELVIIGGGPAGMAAALSAREEGIEKILILEREDELGGILNQCIHNGFGLHIFKEELTGPEYAYRYIEQILERDITYKLHTMVTHMIDMGQTKKITAVNRQEGTIEIQTRAVILAMGCRERPRGALNIPGFRPRGIYTAGTAQRLVNREGVLPGKEVVILGSGDIGLIMARRMTLEGATVKAVVEIMPQSGGLQRNIVQCLEDFSIPLKLNHTVINIKGKHRIEGVTLAQVDENRRPIIGTEEEYACDTLLLSVGLIPENELTRELGAKVHPQTHEPVVNELLETTVSGVFACGNVCHVHDLVDHVSKEAKAVGKNAAIFLSQNKS